MNDHGIDWWTLRLRHLRATNNPAAPEITNCLADWKEHHRTSDPLSEPVRELLQGLLQELLQGLREISDKPLSKAQMRAVARYRLIQARSFDTFLAEAPSAGLPIVRKRLSLAEADAIEVEMRRIEGIGTKRELRLFMQSLMPCGHAVGNLLTCDAPPVGCVICGEPPAEAKEAKP